VINRVVAGLRRKDNLGGELEPYFHVDEVKIFNGDALEVMCFLESSFVDSIVTDPPYGLKFMGKDWDYGIPGVVYWEEALRVAKPGAHLLAFGGTRTFHRLMCAIEDAGWEIRDTIMWVYGSGFPKSLDVSKAIDKTAGVERKITGEKVAPDGKPYSDRTPNSRDNYHPSHNVMSGATKHNIYTTTPATPEAIQWNGWGTALKPAWEPIIVARKPVEGTVARNALKYGVGALNIDGCRVGDGNNRPKRIGDYKDTNNNTYVGRMNGSLSGGSKAIGVTTRGRWPANLIHDGSNEVLRLFPYSKSGAMLKYYAYTNTGVSMGKPTGHTKQIHGRSEGSAARFFYCAKASKKDRDEGLDGIEPRWQDTSRKEGNPRGDNPRDRGVHLRRNHHPTVKPTPLMRYLCRLVTPPNGIVFDPFMGSGSTGKGAVKEGFRFIGIDNIEEYCEIATKRIGAETRQLKLTA